MDSTVTIRMQSTEAMFALDAIQRRVTELNETPQEAGSLEASAIELATLILNRLERRLREALYPTEPLFPYLDDFPPDMTAARLAAESESELRLAFGDR